MRLRKQNDHPAPPKHLEKSTRAWFSGVVEGYELEPHHIRLLTLAGEAWDRCGQARTALQKFGLTYSDRFGCPRSRPEIGVERDSRLAFARLLRELDLNVTPPADPKRPPSLVSNRRI
jgi:phage terminase small subunit